MSLKPMASPPVPAEAARGAQYTRYRGLPQPHLQQVMTAVALRVRRLIAGFDHFPRRLHGLPISQPLRCKELTNSIPYLSGQWISFWDKSLAFNDLAQQLAYAGWGVDPWVRVLRMASLLPPV